MKQTIRRGVFETNSSSVHSLTLCNASDFNKWISGEMLYSIEDDKFVPVTEVDPSRIITPDMEVDEDNGMWGYWDYTYEKGWYLSYNTYCTHYKEETYFDIFEEYKNIGGVDVAAFGYFGEDR